jgi:hypothetical protein
LLEVVEVLLEIQVLVAAAVVTAVPSLAVVMVEMEIMQQQMHLQTLVVVEEVGDTHFQILQEMLVMVEMVDLVLSFSLTQPDKYLKT